MMSTIIASRATTGLGSTLKRHSLDFGARLKSLRFSVRELNGGLGDIGVMAPIVAALVVQNGFNATGVLLVFGLTYVVTGIYFGIPVPVQPLKAMAAIAIAQGLSPDVVSTAGLMMALVLVLVAASGQTRHLASIFTRPVVRGIQLGVGVFLIQAGLQMAGSAEIVRGGPDALLAGPGLDMPVSLLIAAVLTPLLFAGSRTRFPVVLVLLPAAIIAGAFALPSAFSGISLGPQAPSLDTPGASTVLTAAVVLVLPQLPLTLGNAVVASTETAHGYFGERAARVNHRSMLLSKGFANTVAGLIGGMPVCHGAGGLTAHYRFGARTGGATVMLGLILIILAVGLGAGAAQFLALIPLPVLGALLFLVGIEHSLLARDIRGWPEIAVVGVTAGAGVVLGNLAIGFAAGIALDLAFRGLRMRATPSRSGQPPVDPRAA